jgi:hypothetical protein
VAQAYRALLCTALLGVGSGCAHEVVLLDPSTEAPGQTSEPLGLTVSVLPGSFDRCRLQPKGVLERFATALREARLFQGVLYPVPRDVRTPWEIEILAADEIWEPNSNLWKAFLATALLPTALFVKLENDYTLELELLLLENRTVVGSYRGQARIRHRYGRYANRAVVDAQGVETAVRVATHAALARLEDDLERIREIAR